MGTRKLIRHIEEDASLPTGNSERFVGYEVIGLPFTPGTFWHCDARERKHYPLLRDKARPIRIRRNKDVSFGQTAAVIIFISIHCFSAYNCLFLIGRL
jgi:hypothetical protein